MCSLLSHSDLSLVVIHDVVISRQSVLFIDCIIYNNNNNNNSNNDNIIIIESMVLLHNAVVLYNMSFGL